MNGVVIQTSKEFVKMNTELFKNEEEGKNK
jgi:hypothetical protein